MENSLLYISDRLLTSMEESTCGTLACYTIHSQEHWPPLEDYGYRKLHFSSGAAQLSIRCSHGAFQILVAQCSLAFALWMFLSPTVRGDIPTVSTTTYDLATTSVVLDWYLFL